MDESTFSETYRRHRGMALQRALRIVGVPATAEDLAQQAFVRLIDHLKEGGEARDPGAFLYRTVTNLALNFLRDTKNRAVLTQAHWTAAEATAADLADRLAVRHVLTVVPEEQAVIASYYYVDGLDQEEIAALLGLPRRTVGRRLEAFNEAARALLQIERRPPAGKASDEPSP